MHGDRRLPRLEADGADRDALGRRRTQGNPAPVAGHDIALGIGGRQLHLHPLGRRIGVAGGAADGAGLAEHVPGLERLADLELDALVFDLAAERKAELGLRLVPVGAEVEALELEVGEDVEKVLPDVMAEHEPVVQRRAPARQRPVERRAPEPRDDRPDEKLLGERHARVRRHLEAAELDEAETAGRPVGRIELVDAELGAMGVAGDVGQKVAQQPVEQPRAGRGPLAGLRDLRQRDLELVETVVARLVDARRLAGRADEETREEVAEARPPEPVGDEALQAGPGRRRNGLSSGVAPPTTTWLPPPVPECLPSIMNLSAPRRACRASS